MKPIIAPVAMFLLVACFSLPSRAQFLKSLMSSVNQSIQNRAAGKVAGKPDSTTKASGTAAPGMDSAAMAKWMSSIAQPKKPSISPADSAAAIKAFTSASGGSGLYYSYLITEHITMRGKDSTAVDTSQTSLGENGNSRSEFSLFGMKMSTLGHANQPKYSVSLDTRNKTYWLNIIDTAQLTHSNESYTVTKVGSETVAGYPCIHSKLTFNGSGMGSVVEDIWTSTAVPGYASVKKMMTVRNVTPKMITALDQAGCGGFFVKVSMQSPNFSMNMVLITADHRSFPGSLFEIPSGYTQSSGSFMFAGMMQALKKQ